MIRLIRCKQDPLQYYEKEKTKSIFDVLESPIQESLSSKSIISGKWRDHVNMVNYALGTLVNTQK